MELQCPGTHIHQGAHTKATLTGHKTGAICCLNVLPMVPFPPTNDDKSLVCPLQVFYFIPNKWKVYLTGANDMHF